MTTPTIPQAPESPKSSVPSTLRDLQAELDDVIERYVTFRSLQRGGHQTPRQDVRLMVEKRVLRESADPAGGGVLPEDISWKTPVGDLLLALTVGRLHDDLDRAPDAWGQFADEALHGFADELEMVIGVKGDGSRCWEVLKRIMTRMRASAVAFRRLHEARHGMSPHWGGQAPTETDDALTDEQLEKLEEQAIAESKVIADIAKRGGFIMPDQGEPTKPVTPIPDIQEGPTNG